MIAIKEPDLSPDEIEALEASARALRQAYSYVVTVNGIDCKAFRAGKVKGVGYTEREAGKAARDLRDVIKAKWPGAKVKVTLRPFAAPVYRRRDQ